MADRRRLQGEIDKTLKKVNEGCEAFDDIWSKILSASNSNQKDKYETELKKEIKKLQRLREQIKNWQSSNEIKDKKPLGEARRSIEHQMEKFRAIERDIKSKSKDGQASKFDPLIKEQEEIKEWLSESVNELNNQVESYEEKLEELNSNKKKRTDKDKIETIKTRIEIHRKYVNNLEKLISMVQDNSIGVKKVQDIKEDIDEYIEHNEEPDFEENQYLFDDLNLDKIMSNPSSHDNDNEDEDEDELDISHSDNSSSNSNSPCGSPTPFLNISTSNTNTASSSANTTANATSHSSQAKASSSNNNSSANDASSKKRRRHKSEGNANNTNESEQQQQSPANTSAQQASTSTPSNQNAASNTTSQQRTKSNSNANKNPKAASNVQSQSNASPIQSSSSATGVNVSSSSPQASSVIITSTTSPISFSAALLTNTATTTTTTSSQNKPTSSSTSAAKQSTPQHEEILSISPTKQPQPVPLQQQPPQPTHSSSPSNTTPEPVPLNGIETPQPQQQPPQQLNNSQDYLNMINGNGQQAQDPILSQLNPTGNMNSLKSIAENAIERLQMQQQLNPSNAAALAQMMQQQQELAEQTARLGIQIPPGSQLAQNANLSPSSLQMLNQQQAAQQQQVQLLQQQQAQQQQQQQQQQNTNQEMFIQPIHGVAPLGKVPLSKDQSQQLDILDAALKKLPQPSDTERLRSYFPRAPVHSPHYPVMPPPGHDTLDFLCKLSTETLFFMFYYMEGTKAQFLAAQALKKLSWRFHIRYMMWFQRSEEPEMITDDFEQGTYIYFDFEKWAQRKKEGFTFEYKYLEDKDLNAY